MSNRRKPRTPGIPLHGQGTPATPPPAPADISPMSQVEWSDQPPAQYTRQTLAWIAEHRFERGRMNVWQCEACAEEVLCFDRHPGVTPFMVSHATLGEPDCPGVCRSHMYSGLSAAVARDRLGGPSHEWYRPSAGELSKADRYTREHVAQGGLLVRPVPESERPVPPEQAYRGHSQGPAVVPTAEDFEPGGVVVPLHRERGPS